MTLFLVSSDLTEEHMGKTFSLGGQIYVIDHVFNERYDDTTDEMVHAVAVSGEGYQELELDETIKLVKEKKVRQ